MALDLETKMLEKQCRARGVRRTIARRIVRGNAHQLGEKARRLLALLSKKFVDDRARIGHQRWGRKFSMKRRNTRAATPASSSLIASAGLWLMPPLQRTKSMPMSVIALIAMPS